MLECPSPDEPVGLVPPVFPMTKEPGGEEDDVEPPAAPAEGGDKIPIPLEGPSNGVPPPPGVLAPPAPPLPGLVALTNGDGEA